MSTFDSIQQKITTRISLFPEQEQKLTEIKKNLEKHQNASLPHKVVQFCLAAYLLAKGYETVKVEFPLNLLADPQEVRNLRVDIYGKKQYSTKDPKLIFLEVETGHVPSTHHSDPVMYRRTRDSAKVARYFYPYKVQEETIDRIFGFVIPQTYTLQLPSLYVRAPHKRKTEKILAEKRVLDCYYDSPTIPKERIQKARVDYIFEIVPDLLLLGEGNGRWLKKFKARKYLRDNKGRILSVTS